MDVINTEKYPLDKAESQYSAYESCVFDLRSKLEQDGVAICPHFLKDSSIKTAVSEVENEVENAFETETQHNIFLDGGDPKFPKNHIRNKLLPTTVASVAYDQLPADGILTRLYQNDGFVKFLQDVLQLPELYRLDDPYGSCYINLYKPGGNANWHFDESHFSTTIMLQTAETGGEFEKTLPIRGEVENYEQLDDIVNFENPKMYRTLNFEPGTLSIFQGSKCLHRVTKISGNRNRLLAVLCFATKPGVKNSKKTQKRFFGRQTSQNG